ncbi:testis-expressed protein 47-like [Lineus longissimus]|uniref:testis-expressed protein 47-like n=1 Tax=Lineus longissimus TaxID=88925 RepID=UPI00315D1EEC
MANLMEEDSLLEGHRTSLLDVQEDKLRAMNKKALLHRVVIVSKQKADIEEKEEIGTYYDKLFKNLNNQLQSEGVSGLLLVYPECCLHVIETCTDMLLEIIKDLQTTNQFTEKSKILVVSHDISFLYKPYQSIFMFALIPLLDGAHLSTLLPHFSSLFKILDSFHIPTRLYQTWSFRVLDMEAQNIGLYEPSDDNHNIVIDVLQQVIKLGSHLAKIPKLNWKSTMDNLREKVPDLLPQQIVIGYLLDTNDKSMIEIEDFLTYYSKPYDIVLNGELVWPMPVRLFPYN